MTVNLKEKKKEAYFFWYPWNSDTEFDISTEFW